MAKSNHSGPHKYYHADLPFGKVWACALSGCNHHMPQHYEPLLNGKYSLCWECGEKFILTPLNMQDDQPRCTDCKLGREPEKDLPLSDAMKEFVNRKIG